MLIRATYDLCPEKATALVGFLNEFASDAVELRQTDGSLTVTAAPEVQHAVGQFISLLLQEKDAEVAGSSAGMGWIAHLAESCPVFQAAAGACAVGDAAACRHNCSPDCTDECEGECTAACPHVVRAEAIDQVYWNPPLPAPFGMPAIAPAGPIHAAPGPQFAAALPPGLSLPAPQIRPPAIHRVFHTTDRPLTLVLEADLELLQEVDRFIEEKTKDRAVKQAQQDTSKAPFTFHLGITR
jgi:hypothetical protein